MTTASPGPASVHHVLDLYYEVTTASPGPASVHHVLDLYYVVTTASPGPASVHHKQAKSIGKVCKRAQKVSATLHGRHRGERRAA